MLRKVSFFAEEIYQMVFLTSMVVETLEMVGMMKLIDLYCNDFHGG